MRAFRVLRFLPLLSLVPALAGCDRLGGGASASDASADAAKTAQGGGVNADAAGTSTAADAGGPATAAGASAAASSTSRDADPRPRTYLAYQGKLGGHSDLRMVLVRTGNDLDGLYTVSGGEVVDLTGHMKDATRFTLTEIVPKGKKPGVFDGQLDGLRITGTWKEPAAKTALPFTAGPLDAFGGGKDATSFDETYVGTLGGKLRIRMKLKRAGTKLSGAYRYTRSHEDLVLDGDVDGNKLALTESTKKGLVTGRFEGVFVRRGLVYGRWTTPDGARPMPFALNHDNVYPEVVALPGGGKIVPQEIYKDQNKLCTLSVMWPEVDGANKPGVAALNAALKTAAGDWKMDCAGATAELPYESDTAYHVDAPRPGRFVVSFSSYQYTGGAHGMHGSSCYAADVEKGTLTPLTVKLLAPDARKKLGPLVNEALRKENGGTKLSEAGFNEDTVPVSDDTSLCVEGNELVVQFGVYEVGPYALGAPEAKIPAKDAAALLVGTPLEPFVK